MNVVYDASVVAGAVCWNGDPWHCLIRLAQRKAFAWGTDFTLHETRRTCLRLIQQKRPKHNAAARLTWYLENVRAIEAAPLGKPRSRDVNDDPNLACALAAQARYVVTLDHDLLALEKPFGIEMVTPTQFLRFLGR
ncbi:MAG TPA: PIN domain-containing protein [Candidatus Acidoferrum sp.]|nr:PIN domain-containing protein [Candidatus Acidoferrum sp.]